MKKYDYQILYNNQENSDFQKEYEIIDNKLIFFIDFNLLEQKNYRNKIKKFLRLKKNLLKKYNISQIYAEIYNYNVENKKQKDFIDAINAIMQSNKKDMYNFIYDNVCNYLDKFFVEENLCDFKDDRCGEKAGSSCIVGCCRHFELRKFPEILFNNKLIECEYLKDKRCSAKCISCKLFTCDYLRKKGVKFKLKEIFLIDSFFNPIQKYFIKYRVFTKKEKILKLLLNWSI